MYLRCTKPANVECGPPPESHDTSILDGNLFSALQAEASCLTLQPKKSKTVQLMEVTEKLWKSDKYQKKAREAMEKLPSALKAIAATNGGPTGRALNATEYKQQSGLGSLGMLKTNCSDFRSKVTKNRFLEFFVLASVSIGPKLHFDQLIT